VLNRIYQSAMVAGSAPGLKGALFRRALAVKLERLRATGEQTHPVWDRIVFNKVRQVLGGEIVLIGSGSAPITAEVMDFLKVAMACDVIEGTHLPLFPEEFPSFLMTWRSLSCRLRHDGERRHMHTCMAKRPLVKRHCRPTASVL
jgi:hypothetical protein